MLLYILKTIHIVGATLWFAYPLGQARALRLAASADDAYWELTVAECLRRVRLSFVMGVLTTGAGALLIFFMYGSVGNAPSQLHGALGLVILMLGCTLFGQLPAVTTDPEEVVSAERRKRMITGLARWTGVIHFLWLLTLVLMYVR